jgi:hypothetical protein
MDSYEDLLVVQLGMVEQQVSLWNGCTETWLTDMVIPCMDGGENAPHFNT